MTEQEAWDTIITVIHTREGCNRRRNGQRILYGYEEEIHVTGKPDWAAMLDVLSYMENEEGSKPYSHFANNPELEHYLTALKMISI